MKALAPEIIEFLDHSNRIESEYSKQALDDAKKAWRYAMGVEKMTVADIVEIQRLLLHRIEPENNGFRTYPVRIGWQIKKFDSIETFERQLESLLGVMNDMIYQTDIDQTIKNCHVIFEDIHPFPDGNGRTGRILFNWHHVKYGHPVRIIHEGDEQFAYYKWFDKVKPI